MASISLVSSIQACDLPPFALLARYRRAGAYTDCYVTEITRPVSLIQYVEAFYTTWVFKLERLLLAWIIARPSTDLEAQKLAAGQLDTFSAWNVEERCDGQMLLADLRGRTRSWLMIAPAANGQSTRLFFGSAVVPVIESSSGKVTVGFASRALLEFHKLYSRILLQAAADSLRRSLDRASVQFRGHR